MIPFWYPGPIDLPFGPDWLEFHVFGILVGIGVVVGSWIAQKRAEVSGLHPRVAADLGLWVVIVSFFFAHQISLFAYFPERVFGDICAGAADCFVDGEQFVCKANGHCDNGDWTHVLQIWNGISSFGGFLGAAIAFFSFFALRKIVIIPRFFELAGGKGRPTLKYLDAVAAGFIVAWFFGRLGCFSAHDHVGIVSDSFLAVNFPDGWRSGVPAVAGVGAPGFTPRLDLGLLEVFYTIPLIALFFGWAVKQRNLRPGWYCAVMAISYAPYRFYLDTLRATDISGADKRYFADLVQPGLTPGQLGAIAVLVIGLYLWWIGGRRMKDPAYMALLDGNVPAGEVPGEATASKAAKTAKAGGR